MNQKAGAKCVLLKDCRASLAKGVLTLENRRIRRRYRWNEGHLISLDLTDVVRNRTWALNAAEGDCALFGISVGPSDSQLLVEPVEATPIAPAHLRVKASFRMGTLEVLRQFRLYPDCPAIGCDYWLRGQLPPVGVAAPTEQPMAGPAASAPPVIERIIIWPRHTRQTCVRFHDNTDFCNNLKDDSPFICRNPLPSRCGNTTSPKNHLQIS